MKPITLTRIGQIWASDIATFTTSKYGNKYVMVVAEYLSKWVVACALDSFDSDMIAQVLLYEVVLKYGLPERIISDNGSSYVSDAITTVLNRLGISRSLTSVEHPQTDGLVERFNNRTMKASLSIVAGQEPNTWCKYLPFVAFVYNTAVHASTNQTPFRLMHGREAILPLIPAIPVEETDKIPIRKWGTFLNRTTPLIYSRAVANIKKAQEAQKQQYDRSRRQQNKYYPGNFVARKNIKIGGFPKERWTGPWVIIEATNSENTAYRIYNKKNPKNVSKSNVADLRKWYSKLVPALVSVAEDVPLLNSKILLDTGSMISTISLAEAKRLTLEIKPAPPIRITYGNQSQGMSNTCVRFVTKIQEQVFPAYFFRVLLHYWRSYITAPEQHAHKLEKHILAVSYYNYPEYINESNKYKWMTSKTIFSIKLTLTLSSLKAFSG